MKTIVSAIDFSANSVNAAYYAAELARELRCQLRLIHVVEIPVALDIAFLNNDVGEMQEESENSIYKLREDMLKYTQGKVAVSCNVTSGSVPYELQNMEKSEHIMATVVGQDDSHILYRMLAGSHTWHTVKNVKSPVLIIPKHCSYNGMQYVLLASDLKAYSDSKPIQLLRNWLKMCKSKLDILHVYPESKMRSDVVSCSIMLENDLFEFNPRFHYFDGNSVEDSVLKFVKQHCPDLLVVFPKKYGFLENLFHKSQSKNLLLHTNIPVLAIPM